METNKREQTPQEDTHAHTHIRETREAAKEEREKESEKYKRKIQEEEKERRSNDDDDDGNGSSRRGKRGGGERRATKDNCYPAKRELLRRFGTMVSPRARTKL